MRSIRVVGRPVALCASICLLVLLWLIAGPAAACSVDEGTYLDGLVDSTCLESPLAGVEIDALGGLRLATAGTSETSEWDTDAQFDAGVNYDNKLFGPVGVSTLERRGAGTAAAVALPATLLPLTPGQEPVLGLGSQAAPDGDHVRDPSVVRTASGLVMFYVGWPEDGGDPAIFRATSSDGVTWTKSSNPVLEGTADAFDLHGVTGPMVIHTPGDAQAPWRMWYSGRGRVFEEIGYATSADGVTWTKHEGPVLQHGPAGSGDSFGATDPAVMRDGAVWRMWYTADDSTKRRIAYATSSDGITWSKGGTVIAPEDGSANIEYGAFSPTVWKDGSKLRMLLAGRKTVAGGVFQTKLLGAESDDGLTWTTPSPVLNPSNNGFDASNLDSPDVLLPATASDEFRLFYAGDSLDAAGNGHTRIGLATSQNGTSFARVNGPATDGAVLDIGTASDALDARSGGGLSVVPTSGGPASFVGVYAGVRGKDFIGRLGAATSNDGAAWTKTPLAGSQAGALFEQGGPAAFDHGGHADPAVLAEAALFDLFFTALDKDGEASIGATVAPEDPVTHLPDHTKWAPRQQILAADGSGFDSARVEHPSVIDNGGSLLMAYTGVDANGIPRIGSASATSALGPWTRGAMPTLDVGAVGEFDHDGVKDPVLARVQPGDLRMLYTGVEQLGDRTIERIGYATSTDGITWTKHGPVLNPSAAPYAADEAGVRATGIVIDGGTLGVYYSGEDRTGRVRALHATTAFPTPATPELGVWSGSATYQLGDPATPARDFRSIMRASSGQGVELWMSFLQPYGADEWSEFFPVTAAAETETLNFLLTVRAVRWQLRLRDPSDDPAADKVQIQHAPIQFTPQATVTTKPFTAPTGRSVQAWKALTVSGDEFSPGGAGPADATVAVHDAATDQQLAAQPVALNGDTVVDLASVDPTTHPALRARVTLHSGDGATTPVIRSLAATFTSGAPKPKPPVTPPQCPKDPTKCPPKKFLTFTASATTITYGQSVTLSGTALPGAAISLDRQPLGATTFTPWTTLTAGTTGAFSTTAKPGRHMTYRASTQGVGEKPVVTVRVRHRLTLRARLEGSRLSLTGRLGPRHARRLIVIQRRTASGWRRFARTRTTRRSRYAITKRLTAKGRYRLRARVAKDARHLAGRSRVRTVTR